MLQSVNIHSSVAIYAQIENHVQFAVASGRLKAGDQLPSVRELSERLDVNPNTVAKAYRDLEVMGLLYTRRGMGVFIGKGSKNKCRTTCRTRVVARLYEVIQEAKAAGISKKELVEVVDVSHAIEASPYAEVPSAVASLAKRKR